VVDTKLVVLDDEAARVKEISQLYITLLGLVPVVEELIAVVGARIAG
jgi:hypothetical protein